MSLALRLAFHFRQAAASLEQHHRRQNPWPHQWEISRRAKQFVADHAHITDLDQLTDLAIKRGIYSSKQPRKVVRWRMERIRRGLSGRFPSTQSPVRSIANSLNGEPSLS